MTGSRPPLSEEERSRIAAAVRAAETRTSGEIVVMVSAGAGLYRSIALAFALIVGLAVPWPLIALSDLSAAQIFLIQAIAILLAVAVGLSERTRIALVPRTIRRRRAHEAAHREFLARGLDDTRGRTGVLIYVALAERYAEIVADSGVRARVHDTEWRASIESVLDAAGRGALAEGLVSAVAGVGDILAKELPPGPEGDELPDRVIVVD